MLLLKLNKISWNEESLPLQRAGMSGLDPLKPPLHRRNSQCQWNSSTRWRDSWTRQREVDLRDERRGRPRGELQLREERAHEPWKEHPLILLSYIHSLNILAQCPVSDDVLYFFENYRFPRDKCVGVYHLQREHEHTFVVHIHFSSILLHTICLVQLRVRLVSELRPCLNLPSISINQHQHRKVGLTSFFYKTIQSCCTFGFWSCGLLEH